MKRRPHHQVDMPQPQAVRHMNPTAGPTAGVGSNREVPELERSQALVSQLEYLLRTHGDEEALSEQSSLQDVVAKLRHLANDLGLDFVAAVARSDEVSREPPSHAAFDPRI